jgi:hypothetical protein
MGSLISWAWSFIAGLLSMILLVVAWGSLISVVFAIIGVLRGRSKVTPILIYLLVCVVASLLFRSIFWVSDRLMKPDTLSTALFWGSIFIAVLGAIKEVPRMLKETWQTTNGKPSV